MRDQEVIGLKKLRERILIIEPGKQRGKTASLSKMRYREKQTIINIRCELHFSVSNEVLVGIIYKLIIN